MLVQCIVENNEIKRAELTWRCGWWCQKIPWQTFYIESFQFSGVKPVTGLGLDLFDTTELEIECLPWDFLASPCTPPSQLNSLDLIILHNTLHQHRAIPDLLAQIQSMLKPGGFLYICEPTTNLIVPLVMECLSNDIAAYEERTLGPFYSEDKWEDRLQSNGYHIVQKHWDSLLSSTFLCRYPFLNH